LVAILKELARRAGIGYQVLIKRWLDERVRDEHERLREEMARRIITIRLDSPVFISYVAGFDGRTIKAVNPELTPIAPQG
jgi:hypothetical protein